MSAVDRIQVVWQEDGSATVLARVCARDATGAATGISSEGNWIKRADLTSIACNVFDNTSATPDTAIATPSVTISSAIQDTPVTDGIIWSIDTTGYNFIFDMAATCFPTGGHEYQIEFPFVTTGGGKWTLVYIGPASPIRSS